MAVEEMARGARGDVLPLRGRDAEIAELTGWLARLRVGQGGVLLVEAAPGAGKSRLVREARAIAENLPVRVLAGAGEREERGVPFGALLRALPSDGPAVGADVFRTLSESAEQRFWLFRALRDQLEQMARERPLLVVVDDLQWCDAGTLLALRTLPARLSAHPVRWLVTVRTGSPGTDVRATVARLADLGARTMRLGPLPADAAARLAGDLLGAEPGADVLALVRRAEGRPLLVTEIVRGLSGEGAVARTGGTAHLAGRHSPVHSYGSARRLLGHLSPAAREVLRLASVLGRDLDAGRLAALGGYGVAEVVAALQEAVDADLVRSSDPLGFRHDLVREAIRGTVPAARRRELRRRAADLSLARGAPIGQVALAMAETAEPGDADTAALLRRALDELAEAAPDAAAPIARQAVALAPAGSPERAAAVAEAVPLLARVGRGGEGRRLADSVLDGPLPAAVEGRIRLDAGLSALQGSFAEALRFSGPGARLDGLPDGMRAQLMAVQCASTLLTGDIAAADQLLAPATEAAARAGDGAALALLHTTDSVARARRLDFAAAERLAAAAVAAAPDPAAVFGPAVWRASLHGMTGRVEEGLREAADGTAAARRPGRAQGLPLWLATHARLLLAAGLLAEARAEAEAALALAEESGAGEAICFDALCVVGRVAALTGESAAAKPSAASPGDAAFASSHPSARAGRMLGAGEADGLRRPGAWPADDPRFVRMALSAGRSGHAAAVVAEAERRAALNPGVPFFAAVAAHARGLLDDDAAPLRRAIGILRGCPYPLALASALEDAGRLLLDADRDAAVAHLTEAEDGYARTGAASEAARIRRRLGAAGQRQRRRPKPRREARGWHALTPAERRVTALVAEGATNREAAARLFLSPATVGTHVMHVFQKLGVNSRVQLARLYLEHEETAG
ncbi:AAA family ATPase [Actinomadura sp. NAK00032]|uniref:ATP-binding protein n=1 Tax=Actinomadura sp. NAK00032 TaxID=2742128 RepID=UPI001590D990|nr:LuxR family transcriptional regulator [Actinomadura sp. NAK00032]QKW33931.1 AAA family ATPase [Actinomadura sp. NAK00032]